MDTLLEVVFTSLLFTLFGSGFYITLFTSLPFTRLTSLSLLSENRQQKDWKAFEFLYSFLSSINTSLFLYGFDQCSFDTILAYTLEEFRKFHSILLHHRNNITLLYYTLVPFDIDDILNLLNKFDVNYSGGKGLIRYTPSKPRTIQYKSEPVAPSVSY